MKNHSHSTLKAKKMKIAFILFNEMTAFDLIGVYDPISRLKGLNYMPDLEWDFCSNTELVADSYNLKFTPTAVNPNLSKYDVIIVPGGMGTRKLIIDVPFIEWLKSAKDCRYKISVCTGSHLLGAAGFLLKRKATTHFAAYHILERMCKEVSHERIVEDQDVITAGAVTASIDLGLYLCRKWADDEACKKIQNKMDYKNFNY